MFYFLDIFAYNHDDIKRFVKRFVQPINYY